MTERLITPTFGRFRMPRAAWRIIGRLHDYPAHYTKVTLLVGGRPVFPEHPGAVRRLPRSVLSEAQVRLAYGPIDDPIEYVTPYRAVVPYYATPEEIRAGWMEVAFLVGCSVARELDRQLRRDARPLPRVLRQHMLNAGRRR